MRILRRYQLVYRVTGQRLNSVDVMAPTDQGGAVVAQVSCGHKPTIHAGFKGNILHSLRMNDRTRYVREYAGYASRWKYVEGARWRSP